MDILEQHIKGKSGELSLCEDCLTVTPDFIAVIDGVTSKSPIRLEGETTGRFAALTLDKLIKSWPAQIGLEEALDSMTKAIYQVYETHQMLEEVKLSAANRLAASIIIYSRYHRAVWSVGDCQGMVGERKCIYPKLIDDVIAAARALYLETELLEGKTVEDLLNTDTSRDYVLPLIKKAAEFENSQLISPYTFGVVDGFPINPVSVHEETVNSQEMIVLASDGYPKLFSTLEESESYLEHLLKTDPLCFRSYQCTKGLIKGNHSFDDRTYIRFMADQ